YREAEEAYREAIDRLDPLAGKQNGEGQHALALAICHTDLAEVLRLTDRTDESGAEIKRALEIEDELLARDDSDPTFLQAKARTLYNRGILRREIAQTQAALESFRESVTILKTLAGRFEDTPRYQKHLARSYLNLGTVLRDLKEYEPARASYQQAIV